MTSKKAQIYISASDEIEQVLKKGRRAKTKWCDLIFSEAEGKRGRFSIIMRRRYIRKAVHRNRIKRRFYEILRRYIFIEVARMDIIVIPKAAALKEDFHILQEAVHKTVMGI